jgi:hypothetical protein
VSEVVIDGTLLGFLDGGPDVGVTVGADVGVLIAKTAFAPPPPYM